MTASTTASSELPAPPPEPQGFWASRWRARILLSVLAAALMLLLFWLWKPWLLLPGTRPLVMQGGDPYLRALMRTISASESNVLRPYHVLHGGDYVGTLDRHPNRCESIGQGPNRGSCSTAAGRYQLLYSTWLELASRHHPDRTDDPLDAANLSFAPADQDIVVHAWLQEPRWGHLSDQLRRGQVQSVLRRLSGTWTSLGYGIENNSMSRELPKVYKMLLDDELSRAGDTQSPSGNAKEKGRAANAARP
ncbi:MAG: glycoside hydrolase family protein [Hydrogenophaga sp.]|nr:glycoside hydrolase family protein [Hydrogenophaga sp.]